MTGANMTDLTPRQIAGAVKPPLWGRVLVRLAKRIGEGELVLRFTNGAERRISAAKSGARAVLDVANPRMLRKLLTGGDVGLAESYMAGDWTSPDLASVIEFGVRNTERLTATLAGLAPVRLAHWLRHKLKPNNKRGSKKNIAAHYDLGNEFYKRWLDETMTYSSALFERPDMSLADAQRAKWQKMAEMLDLKPGQHVLEIGCGWGGFAMFLAREHGCRVTGLTLSQEQYAHARLAIAREGLSDRIDIRLQDYRDVQGTFDRVASIEMFEAVGEEHWPRFFNIVRERLVKGGVAALQIITIANDRFSRYRTEPDFIQLYIFPGGMLPSPDALKDAVTRAQLGFESVRTFALSYAETLKRWRELFDERWQEIAPLGFDERFKRMWDYYLACCEGGFRAGNISVGQFRLTRT